jgi:predicted transcriptional regulator
MAHMSEKCIAEVTVRLSDTLKRDLQDLAMMEDRKLSDMIRVILETSLYGLKHKRDDACGIEQPCQTMRGNE